MVAEVTICKGGEVDKEGRSRGEIKDMCFSVEVIFGIRYISNNRINLFQIRDNTGLECDTVLHRRNGTYGLIEVKLGGETKIEEGAANLKALADKIDTTRMPAPSFLMVLIGKGRYAFRRTDGIYVVPVGCLKP